MFDDLAKTVKAQLYERVSSPLFGAFAISWVAWNYRFLLILVSSMPAADKFAYIDTNIFNSYQIIFLHGTLYPLITTLLLIFIYPYPAKFVYEYWRKRQRELKEIQQRIDDETPLTREEARELRHQTLNARLEFEQELERRVEEIARLKETIKDIQASEKSSSDVPAKKAASDLPSKVVEEVASLSEFQAQMLQMIAESTNGIPKDSLLSIFGQDRILAEYNLGELQNRFYVSEHNNGLGAVETATHQGRSYLINHARNNNSTAQS